MITNNRIKLRREQLNMSQDELAEKLGYKDKSAICRIETGKNRVKIDKIKDYAKALKTSPAYLMGWVDDPELTHEETLQLERDNNSNSSCLSAEFSSELSSVSEKYTTTLPILGSVAAGAGTYTDNDIIGYEEIPSSWVNPNEQYVILIVEGDSMYPKFEDGDHVLVRVQSSVDSGDYGIVLIDGDSAVIKKITYGDNWIELVSVNPMYPPRRFENEDVLNVRVFALVKKSWRNY